MQTGFPVRLSESSGLHRPNCPMRSQIDSPSPPGRLSVIVIRAHLIEMTHIGREMNLRANIPANLGQFRSFGQALKR